MEPKELYPIRDDHRAFAELLKVKPEDVASWDYGDRDIAQKWLGRVPSSYLLSNTIRDKRDIAGWFYVIQLTPDLKPERLKFGFSRRPLNRLDGHRVSAPSAVILKTYPAVWADEVPCIASVVNPQCLPLTTEAFDVDSIERVIAECDRYFEWITSEFDDDEYAVLLKAAQFDRPTMERFAERLERIRVDWQEWH